MKTNIAAYTESGPITRNVVQYISINEEGSKAFVAVRARDGSQVEIEIPALELLGLGEKIVEWFKPHG